MEDGEAETRSSYVWCWEGVSFLFQTNDRDTNYICMSSQRSEISALSSPFLSLSVVSGGFFDFLTFPLCWSRILLLERAREGGWCVAGLILEATVESCRGGELFGEFILLWHKRNCSEIP